MLDYHQSADKRRHHYVDLEELLTHGFLSHPLSINGVQVCLRTLTPSDWFYLKARISGSTSDVQWKRWLLSTATWMVGGQSLLEDENSPVVLQESLYKNLPASSLSSVFLVYSDLSKRYQESLTKLEAYCYEEYSRALWRMFHREVPKSAYTGRCGMNHHQRVWTSFNLLEDDRSRWQQDWAAAKLVASATSPKGIKRLNQQEESDHRLEESRRADTIARVLGEGEVFGDSRTIFHRARTAEELEDQMKRWIAGEKDWHDLVVDQYKQRIRDKMDEYKTVQDERMSALGEVQEGVTSSVTYGRGEAVHHGGTVPMSVDINPFLQRHLNATVQTGAYTNGVGVPVQGGPVKEAPDLGAILEDRKPRVS